MFNGYRCIKFTKIIILKHENIYSTAVLMLEKIISFGFILSLKRVRLRSSGFIELHLLVFVISRT